MGGSGHHLVPRPSDVPQGGEEARLLHKGDAVVVTGTQSVEEFTRRDGTNGYAIKVNADAIYVSRIPRKADA